jgi:tetrahydromethanopterin S-methyltransferase subunit G
MSTESEQAMKAFMERTDTFMKRIDARLDTIDARLDTIDARLDRVDKTFLNVYAARHHRIAPHWLPGIAA